MKPAPWRCDGMLTGSSDGDRLYRVFAPRWWQLHRWLWWVFPTTAPRTKGWLDVALATGTIHVRCYVDTTTPLSLRR